MSLHDEIEKIDKELGVAKDDVALNEQEAPAKEEKAASETSEKEAKPNVKADEKPKKDTPKKTAEADDEKEPEKEEEKPDSAAFAKLRRDQAAAERRAKAAEEENQRLKQAKAPEAVKAEPAATNKEPDPDLDPEAHLRWVLAQTQETVKVLKERDEKREAAERKNNLRQGAIKAFEKYENDFSPTVNDYQSVTTHGLHKIADSIRTLNPHLQGEELQEAVRIQVLRLAAAAEAQGHDPAEQFYHTARSWGYQPQAEAKDEAKAEEKPKGTDLKKLVGHKAKTAGSLAHGGKNGNTPLSRDYIKGMSFSDMARLSPSDLKEWEAMEGAA